VLLRPKTGLKDMVAELEPGTPSAGRLHEGDTIPVSQTAADVNLDEILASVDADTRDYLTILLSAGGEGPARRRARAGTAIRRFEPTARYGSKVFGALEVRKHNIKRVVHNLSLLMGELGARDDQVAEFVENSNAVFATLAGQDANLRSSLQQAADRAPGDAGRARQGAGAGRRARPDAAGTAAGRAGARADAAQVRPFVTRDRPRSPRRDPALRARLAPRPCASCARRGATSRPRRRPAADVHGRQHAARHARLQPAGQGGGLPLSGSRGRTTSATSSSRPRTRTARSAAACSSRPARTSGPQPGRAGQPAAGVLTGLLNLPKQNCPTSSQDPFGGG
jgi:phospholipid/cholesterol/gamma-HCH transport system substrate-binding protein